MRDLPVDLDEIALGMDEDPNVGTWYLNVETGETYLFLESDELDFDGEDPPDWMDEASRKAAHEIEEGDARWVEIPHTSGHDAWRVMADFADTVGDDFLRTRLADALDGRGAFRRFHRVLADYPEEQRRWRDHEDELARREATEWLATLGIRPTPRPQEPRP